MFQQIQSTSFDLNHSFCIKSKGNCVNYFENRRKLRTVPITAKSSCRCGRKVFGSCIILFIHIILICQENNEEFGKAPDTLVPHYNYKREKKQSKRDIKVCIVLLILMDFDVLDINNKIWEKDDKKRRQDIEDKKKVTLLIQVCSIISNSNNMQNRFEI